jgi:hypothetical protein
MPFNNASAQLLDGVPTTVFPVDQNYLSWSYDPVHAAGTTLLSAAAGAGAAGTLYVAMVKMLPRLVTNIVVDLTTAGATLTASQNFAGIYSGTTLVGTTADQSAAWVGSTGLVTMPLVSPVTVGEGDVYVALFYNGTTAPTFASAAPTTRSEVLNAGLVSPNLRFSKANAGATTALPATMTAQTAVAGALWVALS